MHKSLTFAILCPLIHRAPWHLRPTAMVGNLEAGLSGVWTPSAKRGRDSLCQFYLSQRQHWKLCQSTWHADCYGIKNSHMECPIHKLENEDDVLIDDEDIEEEASRFLHARDGDHLMFPYQCDLCHFRNTQKRDPGPDPRDAYAMMPICRATLDSCWSRKSSTVLANQREQKHNTKASETYGMRGTRRSQPSEPYRVEDDWGMYEAIALLHRSLDKGRNKPTVQFSMMRKLRAFFSNLFHTGNASTGMSSLAGVHGSQFFIVSPTYGFWFKHCIEGCHRRMGDYVLSDRALTIDELLVIQV